MALIEIQPDCPHPAITRLVGLLAAVAVRLTRQPETAVQTTDPSEVQKQADGDIRDLH